MPRPVTSAGRYRPGLDGIRAFAVAGVLAYHFDATWLPGGLLGVGVFFTLSGFLITSILMSTWERRGNLNLGDFWLRRARRLFPALVLVLASVVVATLIVAPSQLGARLRDSFAAAFYVTNWADIFSGNSYFEQTAGPSPFDHLWSLAVEEQFYLIWPLILLALLHLRRGQYVRVGILTSGLAALSFVLMYWLTEPGFDHTRVYEGTDTRAGGVLVGAALAIFLHASRTQSARLGVPAWDERPAPQWLDVVGVAGLAVIAYLAVTTDEYSTSLYTYGILVLSIATVAVIAAAAHPGSRVAKWLSVAPLRWVGERSYGIYLWHMPIIALMPAAFLADQPWLRSSLALALTLALATASWALVENPIRIYGLRASLQRSFRSPLSPVKVTPGVGAQHVHSTYADGEADALRLGVRPPRVHALVGSVMVVAMGASLVSCSAVVSNSSEAQLASSQAPAAEVSESTSPTPGQSTPTRSSLPSEHVPPVVADTSATPKSTPDDKVSAIADPPTSATMTSCKEVVHVGDSTSLGLIPGGGLSESNQVIAQYERVGVDDASTDVKGARSIVERWHDEPNAQEAVKAKIDSGYTGCWVIAMGTNEVANQAVGGSYPLAKRIDLIMDEVGGAPVLWPTVKTLKTKGPWDDSGMTELSDELKAACERYPNLRVYDWRSEVKDKWFINDGIHFTSTGYTERGKRIADALANAFPEGGQPSSTCFVSSD
ncbi:acyltransferase family protein [Demequina oxidasica]|uniref:acyltransferase family protein n=1 Tax=Demequina oxidasica TaxID=676199 RepID=UPI000A025191|nr:acyltransferase family protein [Demequina oxidasica]